MFLINEVQYDHKLKVDKAAGDLQNFIIGMNLEFIANYSVFGSSCEIPGHANFYPLLKIICHVYGRM
ncbi:hypothetical protein ATY89_08050 [Sulfolobus acidocaldarius]|uniref:Uncharacterized protein n=3 Tax=Sulfolobus acidocaldarius TaxID=2285 RepID=A0A0U3GID7_9CREN|nr:hypothetical protein [Sulfolobus acidocaldarius]AGE71943.1 hypothetical protein SacN8_09945 [Sulfolobus acidocaldarius N8]AGE74215.1 hypothetical protein SacRon12I_09965 [Sulfolobus acidocaldarius Ron12/I]ALU29893.1 hypothetical protein ATY89_08050 [Sulfolobus acidocaldarius]ALU32634.1 hypothetical protein ATZ20_11070 [Sulfolobus acidocaldarius]WCM35803.1 hypothetical protein GO597_10920 [Sulfolobus acidocaldarius DSM 639]